MYINNRAIETFKERTTQDLYYPAYRNNPACLDAEYQLRNCIHENNVSVLDREAVKSKCDISEWRSVCKGHWRRIFVEKVHIEQHNKELYNQKQLDDYMMKRNHNHKQLKIII